LLYTSFILVNIIPSRNHGVFLYRSTFVGGISSSSFAFYVYTDYNITFVFRTASDFFFLKLAERNFHIKYIAIISEQKMKYTAGNVNTEISYIWRSLHYYPKPKMNYLF
jgi:hypothetical protein